jgi:hypothetical protein
MDQFCIYKSKLTHPLFLPRIDINDLLCVLIGHFSSKQGPKQGTEHQLEVFTP